MYRLSNEYTNNNRHNIAVRAICSYINDRKCVYIKEKGKLKKIFFSEAIAEEFCVFNDRSFKCDGLLKTVEHQRYYLEAKNTNELAKDKYNTYINRGIKCLYIDVKKIIHGIPETEIFEAICHHIDTYGIDLLE